jgi:hypothetical protein
MDDKMYDPKEDDKRHIINVLTWALVVPPVLAVVVILTAPWSDFIVGAIVGALYVVNQGTLALVLKELGVIK